MASPLKGRKRPVTQATDILKNATWSEIHVNGAMGKEPKKQVVAIIDETAFQKIYDVLKAIDASTGKQDSARRSRHRKGA